MLRNKNGSYIKQIEKGIIQILKHNISIDKLNMTHRGLIAN